MYYRPRRAKQCDEQALAAIYDAYAPCVYAYIYRSVGDAMLADDLVGDVFVRALSAIRSPSFGDSLARF
ncbi:MAG: sigma factor [Anaerolineae bacterium]|jgi:RNA polymerase sigma-70 factor (ECF subfamily)